MPDEKLARAIRSKIRRDMLHILHNNGPTSVHDIRNMLGITESLASRHLKLLYDLGFLDYQARPPEKLYFLKMKEIGELFAVYDKIVKRMKGR